MSEKYYNIRLNETQLLALKNACELRFRLDLKQGFELAEIIAQLDTDLSPDNPNHERIFDRYIDRRNAIGEIIQALFSISSPFGQERTRNKESLIIEDIWQSCRYALYQNNPKPEHYTVDSRPPYQVSDQPLPMIRREEDGQRTFNERSK